MANFKMNPRTGMMEPKENPVSEIGKALVRTTSVPEFKQVQKLRESLAIGNSNNGRYLLARFNGQWRCCGRIVKYSSLSRYFSGPMVNFRQAWASGIECNL